MLSFSSEQAGFVVGWLFTATLVVSLLRSFARKLLGFDGAVEGDDAR
jgi:hypothetical protein